MALLIDSVSQAMRTSPFPVKRTSSCLRVVMPVLSTWRWPPTSAKADEIIRTAANANLTGTCKEFRFFMGNWCMSCPHDERRGGVCTGMPFFPYKRLLPLFPLDFLPLETQTPPAGTNRPGVLVKDESMVPLTARGRLPGYGQGSCPADHSTHAAPVGRHRR